MLSHANMSKQYPINPTNLSVDPDETSVSVARIIPSIPLIPSMRISRARMHRKRTGGSESDRAPVRSGIAHSLIAAFDAHDGVRRGDAAQLVDVVAHRAERRNYC